MRSHNDTPQGFHITDISEAAQGPAIAIHEDGFIKEISIALDAGVTGADAAITATINGVAVTGGVITVVQSGSARGSVFSCYPTGANEVSIGDSLELTSDGASTGVAPANGYFVIGR